MFSHITAKTLLCSNFTRILQLFADGILTAPWCKKISEFHSVPFRRREKCSEFLTVKQKQKQTFKILFRSISRNKKQLGIPFGGTKIDANFRNFIPEHFAEEKTAQNSVPSNKNRRKLSEFCSQAFHGRKNTLNSDCQH